MVQAKVESSGKASGDTQSDWILKLRAESATSKVRDSHETGKISMGQVIKGIFHRKKLRFSKVNYEPMVIQLQAST